jgi:hypothetical protein
MKQLILFLFFSLPFLNISQVFRENYRTTKLEICDAKDNLIFVTDTTDIDLLVTNDSLILSNRETKHNSIYVFGSILKNTKKAITYYAGEFRVFKKRYIINKFIRKISCSRRYTSSSNVKENCFEVGRGCARQKFWVEIFVKIFN